MLKRIPVPILLPDIMAEIHTLIEETACLRSEANRQIQRITNEIDTQYLDDLDAPQQAFAVRSGVLKQCFGITQELRFEANFYNSQVRSLENRLKAEGAKPLSEYCSNIRRSTLRERCFVEKHAGLPLITGQWLNKLSFEDIKYVSKKKTRNIEKETIHRGETLMSNAGTIGIMDYAYKNFFENAFGSEKIIRIVPNQNVIHSGYVYAFLRSQTGQIQLHRFTAGSVIPWITERQAGSVYISLPSDKGEAIGKQINDAYEKLSTASQREQQAIVTIEKELA